MYILFMILLGSLFEDFIRIKYNIFPNIYSFGIPGLSFGLQALELNLNHIVTVSGTKFPFSYRPYLHCFVIYLTVPGSNFLGHFSGIIAGTLVSWQALEHQCFLTNAS